MPKTNTAKTKSSAAQDKKLSQDKKLRREFLKKAEETLLETKKQLLREIQDRVKAETEGIKDEGRDTYDLASDERDREINFILTDREREKLLAIDEALQRIKEKTYGICECGCENCEGEIRLGRLQVLPFTRLCVRCQEETERESKMQRKFEDERTYRKLSITDTEEDVF
ncbi:MAG TPA: TraR/DksA C4-type zinc finger protein [Candidatus Binatia bacterium]|jgi:DnaK suppressor protein